MPGILDHQVIGVACPHCGHQHAKTIGWLKENNAIPCVCGQTIMLDPDDFAQALAEIEKQIGGAGDSTKH
jgi:hypothetical protein